MSFIEGSTQFESQLEILFWMKSTV